MRLRVNWGGREALEQGVGFKKNGECEDRRKTVLRNVSLHCESELLVRCY